MSSEAQRHSQQGNFHPDGVSASIRSDIRHRNFLSYGDHVVIYDIPKDIFKELPTGEGFLSEKVFKHNIPDNYRIGIIKK